MKALQQYFVKKDKGYSFEEVAKDVVIGMDNSVVQMETTRPFKDGGIDAEGQYRIFKIAGNSINVEFYMQAKCYSMSHSVTTKDVSRLVARIKNRQFGVMATTSYVAKQAYDEILEDGHPIVLINGKDIIDYVYDECEIRSEEALVKWLELNY